MLPIPALELALTVISPRTWRLGGGLVGDEGRLLTGNDEEKGADEECDSLYRIANETGVS